MPRRAAAGDRGARVSIIDGGVALALAGVLFFAAVSKLIDIAAFERALRGYRLLGSAPTRVLAWAIPWLEIAVGTLVVLWVSPLSAAAATALFFAMVVALVLALRRGAAGDCGCFGKLESRIGTGAVVRATSLALVGLGLAMRRVGGGDLASERLPLLVAALAVCVLASFVIELRPRSSG